MKLQHGDIFLGKYEVSHELGRGAFGRVYRARQINADRDVAIKLLSQADETARRRFEIEAKVVAGLVNPSTVKVFDYGSVDDTPYMVLEYIRGRTLRELIDWRGPFEPARAIHVILRVLWSLAEAHERGIIHRDLKPSNIVVREETDGAGNDRVKVLDFGLALTAQGGGDSPRLTSKYSTVGTLQYMSPEQTRGSTVSPASDVFSVGVAAFEMLTGSHPYPGVGELELVAALRSTQPILLPPGTVSPEVERVIHRMLAKDPRQRFADASEAAAALSDAGDPTTEVNPGAVSFVEPVTDGASYVSVLGPQGSLSRGSARALDRGVASPWDPHPRPPTERQVSEEGGAQGDAVSERQADNGDVATPREPLRVVPIAVGLALLALVLVAVLGLLLP